MNSTFKKTFYYISGFYNLYIYLQILLITAVLSAQDTLVIKTDKLNESMKEQLFNYPISFGNTKIKDFTQVNIAYLHENKNFTRTQTAKQTQTYAINAMGHYSTLTDWRLFGAINISKIKEKNVGWILTDERSDEIEVLSPHYMFVPRKADWDNQLYALSAGINKNFGKHLKIALKTTYKAEQWSRTLDPRAQITNHYMQGSFQLGYTVWKNHSFWAVATYGKLNKDYTHKYNNDDLNFEAFPDTYMRFNAGYGRIINSPKSSYGSSYLYKENQEQISGGYTFYNHRLRLNISSAYEKKLNNFYLHTLDDEAYKAYQYQNHSYSSQAFLNYQWHHKEFISKILYEETDGKNYDISEYGLNYKKFTRKLFWQTIFKKYQNDYAQYRIGFETNYNQNRHKDYIATVDMKTQNVSFTILADKDFPLNHDHYITSGIQLKNYINLNSNIAYYDTSGINGNTFMREVILHDYAINTSNYLAPMMYFEYHLALKNKHFATFYSELSSKFAYNIEKNYYENLNTNNHYSIQLGIKLNY